MINNKDSGNNNTLCNVFIGLFSVVYILELLLFACLLILSGLKVKNYFKNILIIKHIKMDIKSLEIKNKNNYDSDDLCYMMILM